LNIGDIQLLAEGRTRGNMLKLLWRLKGQPFTILGILWMFAPLLRLGPSGLKDMGNEMISPLKPLLGLFTMPLEVNKEDVFGQTLLGEKGFQL
jgi:hypothetical protein